ncbi:hypothetical protein [Lichenifustis flavocetrariae]|uniref:Uncharacterized protein n=1 Tax=Lichenifustis flavocetrariae TaxID=2949735 RepID=A0AA41Z979_9HYPH|nr:hypothetical protein [Lichenifustis flavocetrariae]MCW6512640.1 hypothetical protein [Lichenifustis flavocetrariae]
MLDPIRADLAALHAKADQLHARVERLLNVFTELLKWQPIMAIHDDILAAISANDAALVQVGAKTDALIAAKSESDAVFGDVLPRVTAQGSAIAALDSKIAGALPAALVPNDTSAALAPAAEPAAAPAAIPAAIVTPTA